MTEEVIKDILVQFAVASIIFYFYRQTAMDKDNQIAKLESKNAALEQKLDACYHEQDVTLEDLREFFRVNQMYTDKSRKKTPESPDSGVSVNGT